MREIRCPYCVEGGNFKVLIHQGGAETWYMCARCGHLTWPTNPSFTSTCATCVELLVAGPWGKKETNQVPDAKDRLLWAAELLDLAEHLICILESGDRGVVVEFAVTDLKAVGEAMALMKVSMPYQHINKRIDEPLQSETWEVKN
jgi:hypothetical protein